MTLTVVPLSMSMEPAVALSESAVMLVTALSTRSPVLAMTVPPMGPMLDPADRLMALAPRFTPLTSERLMEVPAVMSRLPTAWMLLALALLPPSLTLRLMAPAALSRIAPEVVASRLVVEASRMSRPEVTLMAATLSARPLRVVCRLPLSVMSLAPLLVMLMLPLPPVPAVMAPSATPLPALSVRVTSCPALSVPPVIEAALLVMAMLPVLPAALMAVKATAPLALSATLPAVAVMVPSKAPMVVLALSATLAASSDNALPSVLNICPPVAVTTRLPTAWMLLALALLPPSLTLRFTSRTACSVMPPLPSVVRLVVEPTSTSRPATARMPGCAAVRPVLVAVMLAPSVMSLAAPVASRSTMPLEAVTPPRVMAPALVTNTALPAARLLTLTVVPLSMSMEPAVALSESAVMLVTALSTRSPVLAMTVPPMGPMLDPADRLMALAPRFTLLPSERLMEVPAVMSRLPTAWMLLALALLPPSFTLRLTSRVACSVMPPLPSVVRSVVEPSSTSRPATARMPGCAAVRPVLVAVMLAPSVMSLAAPAASRSTMPLAAVTPPRFMVPALVTDTALPADTLPALTVAPLAMSIEPAVALSESAVMPVAAPTTRSPVLATMLPPSALMLVPALSPRDLPERLTVLPSLRLMEAPAVMSRLPAAVRLFVLPLLPPSSTLRLMAPAALSRIAPEVVVSRLVVEASRMSRPEVTLIAATLSASPLRVVCRLPSSVMS